MVFLVEVDSKLENPNRELKDRGCPVLPVKLPDSKLENPNRELKVTAVGGGFLSGKFADSKLENPNRELKEVKPINIIIKQMSIQN